MTTNQTVVDRRVDSPVEVGVRFRYISIKGDWGSSKAEAAVSSTICTYQVSVIFAVTIDESNFS